MKDLVDAVNVAGNTPFSKEAQGKKVLADLVPGTYKSVLKEPLKFFADENINNKFNLEMVIPKNRYAVFGDTVNVIDPRYSNPITVLINEHFEAGADANRSITIAGTMIPKDTVLPEGTSYRYVAKPAPPAQATA